MNSERPQNAVTYDEAKVPEYILPPVLLGPSAGEELGREWKIKRRQELLGLFAEHIYGVTPEEEVEVSILATEETDLEDGLGRLRQVRLGFRSGYGEAEFDLLIALPTVMEGPVPVWVGLNFHGNHTIHSDPAIWQRPVVEGCEAAERGSMWRRWPLRKILGAGCALATAARHSIAPDEPNHFGEGVLRLFYPEGELALGKRPSGAMGAIGAWAWAMSRIVDLLLTQPEFDSTRIYAVGHSRLGKASLWAGAQDTRFAAVISNNSGCMGAALSRRRFGETVATVWDQFPHWFTPGFDRYAGREDLLPVDQHQLLALMAPRKLYVASATEDLWADPMGEFLACRAAAELYGRLVGAEEFPTAMPQAGGSIGNGWVGYHLRPGPHDVVEWDWERFLGFLAAK